MKGVPMCKNCLDSYEMGHLTDVLLLGAVCACCGRQFTSTVYLLSYEAIDKFNEEADDESIQSNEVGGP